MWLEVQPPPHLSTGWVSQEPASGSVAHDEVTTERLTRRTSNAAALEELFKRDIRMVTALVRRVVRSPSDAEDIVQNAFLRVWRAMELGLVRSPRAVLFKTARNLALNHLRGARHPDQAVPLAADADPPHDGLSAEERIIFDEDLTACRRAFNSLPVRCRETLALRIVEELSYKEMSKRLGISVSTLEKHYIRGRRLCRDILQSEAMRGPAPQQMLAAAE